MSNVFGLYPKSNTRDLYADTNKLIEHGFIKQVSNGKINQKRSIYTYSDEWKEWEKNLAGWSSSMELPELKASMETIQKTANKVITDLSDAMDEIRLSREGVRDVTLYVAECSEFHDLGEYQDGIKSVEEALKTFDEIPAARMNGIKAIGISVNDKDNPIDSVEYDIVVGNHIDVDMLSYIPQIAKNETCQDMIAEIIVKNPQLEIRGELPEEIADKVAVLKEANWSIEEQLAAKFDTFAKDVDPYGYQDDVDDRDANIDMIATDIKSGEVQYLVDYLKPIIEDADGILEERINAQKLLLELKEHVPNLKLSEDLKIK